MQTSRDSSVWRSLAVAFGDGLAFGVGVKLTQSGPARPAAGSPESEPEAAPVNDRLEQLEKRLASVENRPAAPPAPAAPAAAPLDQKKVLEAVVHAVDGRLREERDQMDRKIAELEARIGADLKALRQQDHAIATAVENHLEELQDHFVAQVETVRLQLEADRTAVREEVAKAVTAASADAIEERVAPLRSGAAEKERQIAELRQRVEDGDAAMLELLNGIGAAIQKAAARKSGAPAEAAAEPATAGGATPPEAEAVNPEEAPLPSFAQAGKPARLWRVPLVSSILIGTAGVIGAMLSHTW